MRVTVSDKHMRVFATIGNDKVIWSLGTALKVTWCQLNGRKAKPNMIYVVEKCWQQPKKKKRIVELTIYNDYRA